MYGNFIYTQLVIPSIIAIIAVGIFNLMMGKSLTRMSKGALRFLLLAFIIWRFNNIGGIGILMDYLGLNCFVPVNLSFGGIANFATGCGARLSKEICSIIHM